MEIWFVDTLSSIPCLLGVHRRWVCLQTYTLVRLSAGGGQHLRWMEICHPTVALWWIFNSLCSEGVWKWAWASKCYARPRGSPWSQCEEFSFSLHSSLMKISVKYLRHRKKRILSMIQILTANRTGEKVDSSRWFFSRPICLLPSQIAPLSNLTLTASLWSQLQSSVTTSWKRINIAHL